MTTIVFARSLCLTCLAVLWWTTGCLCAIPTPIPTVTWTPFTWNSLARDGVTVIRATGQVNMNGAPTNPPYEWQSGVALAYDGGEITRASLSAADCITDYPNLVCTKKTGDFYDVKYEYTAIRVYSGRHVYMKVTTYDNSYNVTSTESTDYPIVYEAMTQQIVISDWGNYNSSATSNTTYDVSPNMTIEVDCRKFRLTYLVTYYNQANYPITPFVGDTKVPSGSEVSVDIDLDTLSGDKVDVGFDFLTINGSARITIDFESHDLRNEDEDTLGLGPIVGIIIAVLLIVIIVFVICLYLFRNRPISHTCPTNTTVDELCQRLIYGERRIAQAMQRGVGEGKDDIAIYQTPGQELDRHEPLYELLTPQVRDGDVMVKMKMTTVKEGDSKIKLTIVSLDLSQGNNNRPGQDHEMEQAVGGELVTSKRVVLQTPDGLPNIEITSGTGMEAPHLDHHEERRGVVASGAISTAVGSTLLPAKPSVKDIRI